MQVKFFIENDEVQEIIKKIKSSKPIVSDVLDDEGNQYVDLVQEGGGVLGIALLGYTYVLEQVGIRFLRLAGTSAGAINTLLLAAMGTVDKPKTEKIIGLIANKNLYDFVDGPFFVKMLLKAVRTRKEDEPIFKKIVKKILTVIWTLIWIIPVLIYLFIKKGLNKGENFRNWMIDSLKEKGINSYEELSNVMKMPDNIFIRYGIKNDTLDLEPKLKIIAAEITTESKVTFPDMNLLFWNKPGEENPADYVRASMSIPVFFHPFRVTTSNRNKKDWYDHVRYQGEPPEESVFVDGGVLSNFPIDAFHNRNIIPRLPTFGVRLGDNRNQLSNVKPLMKFLMAIFNSARHVLDYQFILQNDDYEQLIQKIDIGEHNWLNFSMSDEDKLDLFKRGAQAASKFLTEFDWGKYKDTREELIKPGLLD